MEAAPPTASTGSGTGIPPAAATAAASQDSLLSQRFLTARARVTVNRFDTQSWSLMLDEVRNKNISVARPVYELFLNVFPTSDRDWVKYIDHEMLSGNAEHVEKLYKRCLKLCPDVELWRKYLRYVTDTLGANPEAFDEVVTSFEFALDAVGLDIASTKLWLEYLRFLESQVTENAFDESVKMENLRKLYQRAFVNPMDGLEGIWKRYDEFENTRNKILAKALLNDLGPKYMAARSFYRERKNYYEAVRRHTLAILPTGSAQELSQVTLWKKLLNFERENPQNLEEDELKLRIVFSYSQALRVLYRFPEIWVDFARYLVSVKSTPAEVEAVYTRGIRACDQSLLLHFAYCDYVESTGRLQDVTAIYEELVRKNPVPLAYITYMRFARRAFGVQAARKVFFLARQSSACSYHIYVTAARMEMVVNKDPETAKKIFAVGLERYLKEPEYVDAFVEFLTALNDETNIRSLYEQLVTSLPADLIPDMWNKFHRFEVEQGSLASVQELEKRKSEAFATSDPTGIYALVQRYRVSNLWPCSITEMASFSDPTVTQSGKKKKEEKRRTKHATPFSKRENPFRQQPSGSTHASLPDLSSLAPFKVETVLLGAGVSLPGALSQFLNDLPLGTWNGPVIDIERFFSSTLQSNIARPDPGIR
eukprot:TRINITY_DN1008_c0_g1_i1.p1 TRINITY_DN1008_c0_g1~~TRINITY_DN1008_c0_g1_i1.p1  ORF type:complete len:651 (-),score=121.45 TRINITY_DN1008_c0_g1_i1:226-2178(-)